MLILKISLNFTLNIVHKHSKFSQIFPEKGLKFILWKKSGFVLVGIGFMLLLIEVNLIPEKQNCKKNAFVAFGSSDFKIVFTLSTKIILFYI